MKTISDAIHCLKELASEMEGLQTRLTIVDDNLTLSEACQRLRATLGKGVHFGLGFDIDVYSSGDMKVEWTLYDGTDHSKAATLEEGVNAVLLKHRPATSVDPVAAIEHAEVLLHKQSAEQIPF